MSFSVRLHSIKCLEESDESSAADEPYVLVTSGNMLPPVPGRPLAITFLHGEWKNFDQDEVLDLIGERPFWGMYSEPWEPENIANVNDVCFVVTVVEHDHGNVEGNRGVVEMAAQASLLSTLALSRPARVARLLDAVRSAIGATDVLPTFDDHVGTKELRLDGSDLAIPLGGMKDKKLEIDGGDEGKWELVFRVVHHRRNVFLAGTRLAAISRASDLMELWAVGQDGLLHGNWYYGRWHGWYTLPGENFNVGTHLAAVTRNPSHMEVWAVGQDGIVRGVWFNGSKWEDWYALPGTKFPPGSALAAVSRHPDLMEVWGIDVDGAVRGRYYDNGWKPENDWYRLDGAEFPVGVHLAAASRSSDHMEVWVVGDDKPILGNRFDGAAPPPQWQGWEPLAGEIFSPGTQLAAVVRKDQHNMHVFAVDMNQHVRDFWFEGDTKRGWYQAGTDTFDQGTPIATVSRHPDLAEVWAVGQNGIVRDNPHEGPGWKGWFPLDGVQFPQQAHVAAVSRHVGHMEVWAMSNLPTQVIGETLQDIIWGNAFFDGSWHGWYPLRWSFVG